MTQQRTTVQRKIVLAAVKKNKNHPTADDIYVDVYKINPKISRGTVYRNLSLLAKNGEITHVPMTEGADCYDYRIDPHYHFRCKECGGVWDVDILYMTELEKSLPKNANFEIDNHHILFHGVCKKCRENSY